MEISDNAAANEEYRVQHRHIVLLVLLAVATFSVFLFTRIMAARAQGLDARVAAIWHTKGDQRLKAGDIEGAVDAFRKATAAEHFNRQNALSLASVLAVGKHRAEALQTLMRLRESDPEDAQINLYLARLQSELGNTNESVQFYENSLYGRWTGNEVDERRRQVRIELVKMLLERNQTSRAISELLILQTELPATATSHTEAGRLFLQAGDPQHALKEFQEALEVERKFDPALHGAGEASFDLGDYSSARRYLSEVNEGNQTRKSKKLLAIAQLVLANDPLARHLSTEEKRRRLAAGLDRALERAQQCVSGKVQDGSQAELQSEISEALAGRSQLLPKEIERNPEIVRTAMELTYRLENTTTQSCGNASDIDEAWLLIGRKHGVR